MTPKKGKRGKGTGMAVFQPNKLTVPFENTPDLLRKLSHISRNLAVEHFDAFVGVATETLGSTRAIHVVEAAAGATDLQRTVGDLHLDPLGFRKSVFNGVKTAGFVIALTKIPASTSTRLLDVVFVIQDAPKGAS